LLFLGEGVCTYDQKEADESPTYTAKKTKRGSDMPIVIGPLEEGRVETVETSGGEDTAPVTVTTTLYDLIAALQEIVEPGEEVLVVATVVSLLRAGRIRRKRKNVRLTTTHRSPDPVFCAVATQLPAPSCEPS